MRVVLIGDVHLCDNPPSIRRETYLEEILDKLEFAVYTANSLQADAIVQAGDLIHVKAPSRTSHALVQKTIDVLSKAEMPVLIVPGNHDMQHDRIDSLPKQPLGTICKAPGIDMLMGPATNLPIFGVPYLYDFPTLLPKWLKKFREYAELWTTLTPLLVTHAPIFPSDQCPPYDFIDAEDWASMMGPGCVYSGHIHTPHGAYRVGETWFCNLGALSRGSLHEETLKRKPRIAIWDSERCTDSSGTVHQAFPEIFASSGKAL